MKPSINAYVLAALAAQAVSGVAGADVNGGKEHEKSTVVVPSPTSEPSWNSPSVVNPTSTVTETSVSSSTETLVVSSTVTTKAPHSSKHHEHAKSSTEPPSTWSWVVPSSSEHHEETPSTWSWVVPSSSSKQHHSHVKSTETPSTWSTTTVWPTVVPSPTPESNSTTTKTEWTKIPAPTSNGTEPLPPVKPTPIQFLGAANGVHAESFLATLSTLSFIALFFAML